MRKFAVVAASVLCAASCSGAATAMTMRVVGDEVILSGRVVAADGEQFHAILANNPSLKTVVLWNSPGGAAVANHEISGMISDRKLVTAVAGYCVSACAMIFLSGAERYFSDGEAIDVTSLGFHGSYRAGGQLAPPSRLNALKQLVIDETDGRADPALVDRWVHFAENNTVRFRYPVANTAATTVFHCSDGAANRGDYAACEPIPGVDAMSMGIVTSTHVLHIRR